MAEVDRVAQPAATQGHPATVSTTTVPGPLHHHAPECVGHTMCQSAACASSVCQQRVPAAVCATPASHWQCTHCQCKAWPQHTECSLCQQTVCSMPDTTVPRASAGETGPITCSEHWQRRGRMPRAHIIAASLPTLERQRLSIRSQPTEFSLSPKRAEEMTRREGYQWKRGGERGDSLGWKEGVGKTAGGWAGGAVSKGGGMVRAPVSSHTSSKSRHSPTSREPDPFPRTTCTTTCQTWVDAARPARPESAGRYCIRYRIAGLFPGPSVALPDT